MEDGHIFLDLPSGKPEKTQFTSATACALKKLLADYLNKSEPASG